MKRLLTRRWSAIVLLLFMWLLAGCGGAPPVTSWPGMVVRESTAYVASSDQILALDVSPNTADARRQLWAAKPTSSAGIGYHSQPTLSADGKTLYFGTDSLTGNSGAVLALDTEQVAIKWTYPMTETDPNPGSIFGSIVLISDTLYFAGGSGQLYALDTTTGRPRWPQPFDTGTRIWSSPAVSGTLAYIASQDHHLYAVNTASGRLTWKFPAEGAAEIGTLAGSPAVYNDTVYVGSFDGNLYALDLNGKLKWTYKANGRLWDPPAKLGGTLYFGDLSGNVYSLDAVAGQPKWPQPATVEGGVRATPLVANGIIYVGTDQNRMYALEADTGRLHWQSPFVGRDGEMMLVAPALSDDVLVVLPNLAGADPVRLYGLNKDTGAMLWRFPPAPPK